MKTDVGDFNTFVDELLEDQDVRVAALENFRRNLIAIFFERKMKERNLNVRQYAKLLGVSVLQVRRLLQKEVGGNLSFNTLIRAADALGLEVSVDFWTKMEE